MTKSMSESNLTSYATLAADGGGRAHGDREEDSLRGPFELARPPIMRRRACRLRQTSSGRWSAATSRSTGKRCFRRAVRSASPILDSSPCISCGSSLIAPSWKSAGRSAVAITPRFTTAGARWNARSRSTRRRNAISQRCESSSSSPAGSHSRCPGVHYSA